jgi:hypothetical protein
MLTPPAVESPRFGFALCLPVWIGYLIDYKLDYLVLVDRYPPHPVEFPRLGFALRMSFVRPCELVMLLNL